MLNLGGEGRDLGSFVSVLLFCMDFVESTFGILVSNPNKFSHKLEKIFLII